MQVKLEKEPDKYPESVRKLKEKKTQLNVVKFDFAFCHAAMTHRATPTWQGRHAELRPTIRLRQQATV